MENHEHQSGSSAPAESNAGSDRSQPNDLSGERSFAEREEGRTDQTLEREDSVGLTYPSRPEQSADEHRLTAIEEISSRIVGEAWVGALPHPDVFRQYDKDVQERMLQWNDAGTTDESRRQDKLVDAQIEQAKTGQGAAIFFLAMCIIASCVSFFVFKNNIAGLAFFSLPLLGVIKEFLQAITRNS